MSIPKQLAATMVLGSATITAQAGLNWPQKNIEVKADAGLPVAEVRFPFKNTGSTAVDVTQVESSCGCTTVALEKRHYEPGEGGEIVARYTIADHTGVQKKTVLVATGDGTSPVELGLTVRIPEVLRITPSFVTWKHGESPSPKKIVLEVMQPDTVLKDITVQSSNSTVAAELLPLSKGHKYQLTVSPAHTDQNLFATLTIHCQFGDTDKVFRSYATVQPLTSE